MSDIKVTAAALVIGDEILNGRTRDENIPEIATLCTEAGIELSEVRIVADVQGQIVNAVNDLRKTYDYVFTTGGIGPTHDDITAEAIAVAFNVDLPVSEEAKALIVAKYGKMDFTPERLRMARIPVGASLIENIVSGAPGFKIENVYVLAGVPVIMRAMLEAIAPTLKGGKKMLSYAIDVGVGESTIAKGLGDIQKQYNGVKIGSYPKMGEKPVYTQVVLRSCERLLLDEAAQKVQAIVDEAHRAQDINLVPKSMGAKELK
ncbi:ADP-ribose pyrophosphatase of COG1058 family [hydrothermal vent metagenome]|uniref:ADP-ribose pyrophosphatase of COG1058 family n=1 Tax=hydrothermal vent metagenome TaxID=652676 RepID=A0A3B0U6T8_9ZZZZ